MTQLLTKAFDEAARLPDQEQNILANWILAELTSELRWQKAFTNSKRYLSATGG